MGRHMTYDEHEPAPVDHSCSPRREGDVTHIRQVCALGHRHAQGNAPHCPSLGNLHVHTIS